MKPKFIQILYFMAIIATIVACQQSTGHQPSAKTPSDNEIWYTTTDGKPLDITKNLTSEKAVKRLKRRKLDISSISGTYSNGRGVIKFNKGQLKGFIEADIFKDQQTLKSVILPASLNSIARGAFFGCSSLTSITIPESVTEIEEMAFYGCGSLKSITIPDGVKKSEMMHFKIAAA